MATATRPAQTIVTLDLEGVLIPEVWIAVAEATGIEALRRTTRDEPDYDVLMSQRLAILAENDLSMSRIETVIAGLSPMPGAHDFLDRLRDTRRFDVIDELKAQLSIDVERAAEACRSAGQG
jgi:phosphoserine/homoserine phosphotransferase